MKHEKSRPTFVERSVKAGCTVCHGTRAQWTGGQAQGLAAKHFDDTGHPTWAVVEMFVRYGAGEKSKPARRARVVVPRAVAAGFVGLPPKGPR